MRPLSTAERAIGSDRKRSTIPFCRSSARPTEVAEVPNTIVWTMIPGIRNCAYDTPGGSDAPIEPPNT